MNYELVKENIGKHPRIIRDFLFMIRISISRLRHNSYFIIHTSTKGGFALIEIIVGASIMLVVLTGIISGYGGYLRATARNTLSLQATYILEEGIEATRILRDFGWSANIAALTTGATYYFSWNGTRWVTTAVPVVIDGAFTRTLVLSPVYRDANQDIAGGGSLDVNTKKATVTVSWGSTTTPNVYAGGTKSLSVYITNLFNN